MERILIFLAALAATLMLCQWFVFLSIREYVWNRRERIRRKAAYTTLILLGVINVVAVRLAFDSEWLPPDTAGRQTVTVAYFTYLGVVLLLTLFFAALGVAIRVSRLPSKIAGVVGRSGARVPAENEAANSCAGPPCSARTEPECEASEAHAPNTPHTRRVFLKWTAAGGIAGAFSLGGAGLASAFGDPRIEEFDLFLEGLDGAGRPVTFIHITDFHYGMFFGSVELQELVDRLNAMEADALFITGDVFHSPLTVVEHAVPVFKQLRPRPMGNLAVMGNHDFYAGERRSADAMEQSGLTLLRNRWSTFQVGESQVHIGGIDDPMVNWVWGANFPKFEEFRKRMPLTPGPKILLSHRPSVLPLCAQTGIDFTVAGHIHGGQIVLPGMGRGPGKSVAGIASDYTFGWYREGAARMYLNRGVGLTFLPWRINCPPEIAVFHLKQARDGKSGAVRTVPL